MKQHLYTLADPKMCDRFWNILQSSTNSGGRNSIAFNNNNNNVLDKNAIDYHHHINLQQHQLYAAPPATLQQLKRLLIENAKELKKCKNEILEKNIEIERLKEENETLKTRVERMERRLNLHKIPTPTSTAPVQQHQIVSETAFNIVSAPQHPEFQQTSKRPRSDSSKSATSAGSKNVGNGVQQKRRRSESSGNNFAENPAKRVKNKFPPASTSSSVVCLDEISTPIWRILPFSSSFVLEGTENITDDAFLKRHQKFENEEKRIIRRDRARQRELDLRLKQNVQTNGLGSSRDPADYIEAIEIVKKLPPVKGQQSKKGQVPKRRRPK